MALRERRQWVSHQQHPTNHYKLRSKFLWMTSSQAWSGPSSHPGGNHTAEHPLLIHSNAFISARYAFFSYILSFYHTGSPKVNFSTRLQVPWGLEFYSFISNSSVPITVSLLAPNRANEWTSKRYLPTGTPQRKAIWRMIKRCFFLRSPPWGRHCIRKSVKNKTKQKTNQKTLNKSIC